jgi:hypothetical protein
MPFFSFKKEADMKWTQIKREERRFSGITALSSERRGCYRHSAAGREVRGCYQRARRHRDGQRHGPHAVRIPCCPFSPFRATQ